MFRFGTRQAKYTEFRIFRGHLLTICYCVLVRARRTEDLNGSPKVIAWECHSHQMPQDTSQNLTVHVLGADGVCSGIMG